MSTNTADTDDKDLRDIFDKMFNSSFNSSKSGSTEADEGSSEGEASEADDESAEAEQAEEEVNNPFIVDEGKDEKIDGKKSLAEQGGFRLVVFGIGTGIATLVLALIFSSAVSMRRDDVVSKPPGLEEKPATSEPSEAPVVIKEDSDLKALAAIAKQQGEIQRLNKEAAEKAAQQREEEQKKQEEKERNLPAPPPTLPPPPVVAMPPAEPVPAPPPPPTPQEQWQKQVTMGSYYAIVPADKLQPPPVVEAVPAPPPPPVIIDPRPTLGAFSKGSNERITKQILVGTTARVRMTTPIIWTPDGARVGFLENAKFIARLEEPVRDRDGDVIIPSGAELVLEAIPIDSNSGMANLRVISAIVDKEERQVPTNAITLRGKDGAPLIAQKLRDKGDEIASNDVGRILISGIATAARLLNRPNTNQVIANGATTVTTTNPQPNLLAGFIEGAFSDLAQELVARNQQNYQRILQEPNIWVIHKGTELQLFVNETIIL